MEIAVNIRKFAESFLPHGSLRRNISILAGGTALSQALLVLASPVLTRLYSAENFGYFQIYLSIMSMAVLASCLRYEQAILLPDKEDVAANLLGVSLLCCIITGTLCAIAVACVQHRSLPSSAEGLRHYLWLIPIAMVGAGIYQALSSWVLRQDAYSRVSVTKFSQALSRLVTQILGGFAHLGVLSLVAGDTIGRVAGAGGLARFSKVQNWETLRRIRWKSMWAAAVRYRDFPLISTGSSIISIAGYAVPPLLLGQFYGAKVLGWFALADRVLDVPTLLIGQSVAQVYSVDAARLSISDPKRMHDLFIKVALKLAKFTAIPFLLFFLAGPTLFPIIFGREWAEAGVYARFFALMQFAAFIAWPLTCTLNILELQSWQLAWDVGRLVLTLGSLLIAHNLGLSARWAVAAFCIGALIGYAANLFVCEWAIRRRISRGCSLPGTEGVRLTLSGAKEMSE